MNSQMSTADFIKSLSNPHSSGGLSTYVDQMNEQVPQIQAEYNETYSPSGMPSSTSQQGYSQDTQQQPLYQAHHPILPAQQSTQDESTYDDNLLEEAYITTKTMANREQILKENLLQSKQEAFQHKKENYLKDLQIAEYVLGNAAEEHDGQRQAEMVNKISEIRNDMMKQELEHSDFLTKFQKVLDDKPPVMSYAPQYDPQETTYKESSPRQDFRKNNAWYDYENPYYNQNLTEKAHEIEQKMINEYQLKNMTNYIESPFYFQDLNARLFKEFDIAPSQMQMPSPQMQPHSMQPQSPTDWQVPPMQNPQNPFLPTQMPRLDAQQNPYPSMPIQHPQQYQQAPQQPQYGYPQNNYGPPQQQYPQQNSQAYGPPVAPVMPSAMPFVPSIAGDSPINYDPQALYSKDAYDMFQETISGLLPNMKHVDQKDRNQLFHSAIKTQGRV